MSGKIEPIVGRYVHVEIDGVMHRIYFEENGSGHSAGLPAHRRLGQPAMASSVMRRGIFAAFSHYRVRHALARQVESAGRRPSGEYRLTTASYTQAIRAFCAALALQRPVVMGCSIGGRIVLNLAIDHAREFRALIGLEAADFQHPWYDTEWLNRPDVHGGEICAALISGLIAPQSPDNTRRETLWGYKQGGPGVFKGDLYFYRVDGDLRGRVEKIDTTICPLYLLTGEYDFSCTPEDTLRTARSIPGAEVTVMEQLGHFPMSENPAQFRKYIAPVLKQIRQAK